MIGIFNNKTTKTDLTFYNGEYILDNICTSYEITEELNGEYSLDITFIINDKYNKFAYDLMVNDSLLKVDDEYGIEYFRIAKVTKTKKKYEIFARHITISETLKMFCEDVRPTSLSGAAAINWILTNSRGNKWITGSSNIADTNTAYYKNKSVYEALFDSDNSFLERWGGEVQRRGFNIAINTKLGADRGVSIRSGKNLKGIEEKSNINTLITSIYPTGFDGISIPEKHIDSDKMGYYSDIYPKEVKFDDVKVKSETIEEGFDTLEEAQEELRKRAKEMFTKDKVDILTSSYEVTFAELQKAEGYKDYSILETTFLGDLVSVYEEKLGIDIKVRVTKRVYDGIKKRRKSTTLSNKDLNYKPPSITQIIEKINKVESTETILQLAKDNATALIKSGLKNSHVIVRENEIIIGDTKDINTMIKVWRWNNGGLGFSNTGYFGEFGTAITSDGAIVADFITTGILNAQLIKTGILESYNGKTWINMDNGTFNFFDKIKFNGTDFEIGNETSSINITDNLLKVKNGNIEIWNKDNTKKMIYLGSDGNAIFGGDIKMELASDPTKYVALKAVPYSNEIGCKLVLGGSTLDNSFSIENPATIRYFWVNRQGTYISNNLYIISDQRDSDPIATSVAFDDGLIYPMYNNKGKLGTSTNKWQEVNATTASFYNAEILNVLYTKAINTNNSNINMGTGNLVCGSGTVNGTWNVGGSLTVDGNLNYSGDLSVDDINCWSVDANYVYSEGSNVVIANGSTSSKMVKGLAVTSEGSTGSMLQVQTRNGDVYGVGINVSDVSLKENIKQIDNNVTVYDLTQEEEKISALETIKKIPHYSYEFIDKEKYGIGAKCGYIAQELKKVNESFAFEVEQESGEKIASPNINAIIPYITLALKEQNEYIRTLEERLLKLEEIINGK